MSHWRWRGVFTVAAIMVLVTGVSLTVWVLFPSLVGAQPVLQKILEPDKLYSPWPEEEYTAAAKSLTLPDRGAAVTDLAKAAPGGAFDPRDLEKMSPQELGYKATWIVERYPFYGLDWDITGLRLESLDPQAPSHPWVVIINGGSCNLYDYYMTPVNAPGWGQYLAQRLNVMIVTIPGNFKYGGWTEPKAEDRIAPYVLDRAISREEFKVRNAIFTNTLIMRGLNRLLMKHTQGDLLLVGHSTSGELAFLAREDPELWGRLKGRFLGWGSGGPARLHKIRQYKEPDKENAGKHPPVWDMDIRSADSYASIGYVGPLNPLREPGMDDVAVARKWFEVEGRRRPGYKQPLQNIEHGNMIELKAKVEIEIAQILKETGNPWKINIEDVGKDLLSSHYARMDGYEKMLWIVGGIDRNHWLPEKPEESWEVFIAKEFREKIPQATVRILLLEGRLTHFGHMELPPEVALATIEGVKWLQEGGARPSTSSR